MTATPTTKTATVPSAARARRRRRWPVACGAAVLAASVLAGCSSHSSGGSSGTGNGSKYVTSKQAGLDEVTTFPADKRQMAPDLTGKTLDGKTLKLSDYRGKIVVLNVWASWCGPCRAEAAGFEQLATDDKAKGVRFVGIDTRDQNAGAKAFIRAKHISYPSLVDTDGKLVLQFKGNLAPQSIPSTLIIDRKGRIAARALKQLQYTQLKKLLNRAIAET